MVIELKKAIVLGSNKNGVSASRLLMSKGVEVLLYDNNPAINIERIKKEIYGKVKFQIKNDTLIDEDLNNVGLCVVSGDFPRKNIVYDKIQKNKITTISDLELGYLNIKGETIAITGTSGKTTITEMVNVFLTKKYGDKVILSNDNTDKLCDRVMDSDEKTKFIIECQSTELEDIVTFKPKVACIVNLSPDHIDKHENYSNYINIKLNVAYNMDLNDTLVLNYEDMILRDLAVQKNIFNCNVVFFSSKRTLSEGFYLSDDSIFFRDKAKTLKLVSINDLKIRGLHNLDNLMASMYVAYLAGVDFIEMVESLKEIKGLEHRIEFVREKNGAKYYNDSASTNPIATMSAIDSIDGKIILIVGGRDKGIDFGDLIMKIKDKVKYTILIGETRKKISFKCRDLNYNSVLFADNLNEAVDIANSYSNVNDNILFSPACDPYDMFKSIETRGNEFKSKVMSLT